MPRASLTLAAQRRHADGRTVTGMEPLASADDCPGIRIVSLTIDPDNALIIVLSGPLRCPACGAEGHRWVVPVFQDRIFHREPLRHDPGE